jgi:hypothetical protein
LDAKLEAALDAWQAGDTAGTYFKSVALAAGKRISNIS